MLIFRLHQQTLGEIVNQMKRNINTSTIVFKSSLLITLSMTNAVGAPKSPQIIIDERYESKIISVPQFKASALLEAFGISKSVSTVKGLFPERCRDASPEIVATVNGSFTRKNSQQQAYLYDVCTWYEGGGYNKRIQGLAIIENNKIIFNIRRLPKDVQGYDMHTLPDIDGDGLNEVYLTDGYSHMGGDVSTYSIIQVRASDASLLRTLPGNFGTCSSGRENDSETALVYSVVRAAQPIFFVTTYNRPCNGAYKLLKREARIK